MKIGTRTVFFISFGIFLPAGKLSKTNTPVQLNVTCYGQDNIPDPVSINIAASRRPVMRNLSGINGLPVFQAAQCLSPITTATPPPGTTTTSTWTTTTTTATMTLTPTTMTDNTPNQQEPGADRRTEEPGDGGV